MGRTTGRKDLSIEEESRLVGFLLANRNHDGELRHGAISKAAREFNCHRNTARAVWERHGSKRPVRGGSTRSYDAAELKEALQAVPVFERMNVRAAAAAISMPKSTVQDYIGPDCPFRRVTVHVRPTLTDEQKLERLRFVVTYVERPIGLRTLYFQDMYDVIHVDEKWFYLYKVSSSFILTEDEEAPHLTCPSKRFITKVMFFAAVGRPRYNYSKKRGFDGKIGIFPLIKKREAKRTTKNQTKGDLVTVPLSVDKHVYYDVLTKDLLPAIQARWPGRGTKFISIQQDNASPHVSAEQAISDAGLAEQGWSLNIRRQPPKSPDLNVLDLGFFNAIQSLQYKKRVFTIDGLIEAVNEAFTDMEVGTLEKCFLTLQAVMEQIMFARGGNDYDLPRVKSVHFPDGNFPSSIPCSEEAYSTAMEVLKAQQ